ncbi:hypothetical protein D3C76_1584940 [compost metagenome]
MSFSKYSKTVCTNLIGNVAVCRYAICTYDNCIDPSLGHNHSSHVIAQKSYIDPGLLQLERG